MKVGDTITVVGPSGLITGEVAHLVIASEHGKRYVTLQRFGKPRQFVLRMEDEGQAWCYGGSAEQRAALEVAEALWDRPKRGVQNFKGILWRKKSPM